MGLYDGVEEEEVVVGSWLALVTPRQHASQCHETVSFASHDRGDSTPQHIMVLSYSHIEPMKSHSPQRHSL
jgi:hypothetical protein